MKAFKIFAVAAVACQALAGAAVAKELKFANYMPPTNPYVSGAFDPFAKDLAAATDNKVTVKIYNGGELGAGPTEQYSRAVDGVADFAISLPGYTAANFPLTLLAELPGVLTQKDGTAELLKNSDLLKKEYRRVQLVSLWTNAENVLFTRDKAVHSLADLKGMKIRVPSRNTGLLVQAWGGSPVSMPVSDIYNALQTGVIDGAMIDGTGATAFKLGEVSKYVTMGMKTTISPFFILMNRDSFRDLTKPEQAAVIKVGQEISVKANEVQLAAAQKGLDAFAAMPGHEIITLTPEEAAPFDTAAEGVVTQVIKETEAKGLPAQKFVAALDAK